jgi:hypothetical protein
VNSDVEWLNACPIAERKYTFMLEVSTSHPGLPALFDVEIPNSPMLFAVLRGQNPGRAFVDHATNPSQCGIRTNEALVFLSQAASQAFLDQLLAHVRQFGHVVLSWLSAASPIHPGEAERVIQRRSFSDCSADSEKLAALEGHRPDGFRFQLIDRVLMERCEWRPIVENICGTLDNFLAHGLGICLMRGQDIVTEAYAPYWGMRQVEICVVTNESERGQGYAAMTCARLIQLCRQRGFEPYWSCDTDNTASVTVARKFGFRNEREYEMRLYGGTSK